MSNLQAVAPSRIARGEGVAPTPSEILPQEDTASRRRTRRIHGLSIVVLGVNLVLVATASLLSASVHRHTEQRLLEQQARQAGAVLASEVGSLNAILAPAAELAASTGGAPETFEASLGPFVGEGKQFASATLWNGQDPTAPRVVLGEQPAIAGGEVAEMLGATLAAQMIYLIGIVGDPAAPHFGYALASQRLPIRYVVYVEGRLPSPRRGFQRTEDAFSNLDYALYADDSETDDALLWSSVEVLPITGRRATAPVAFGTGTLLLVVTPIGSLSGGLSLALPWIVALVGLALSTSFAALTERLLRRRDDEIETSRSLATLSDENARLYAEQLGIAETLQRSLLPDHLPELKRAEVAARYWPAGTASEVGGDFYDLFELGDGRWGLAIGDVCGKGVSAAALTGVARHTIQAAARHVTSPSEVLRWVHEAVKSKGTTMFCTVCFAVLTIDDEGPVKVELALGGHPPPLVCRPDGTSEEIGVVGTVLGIIDPVLTDATYELSVGDTLLLFTDGLTDAPHDTAVTMGEIELVHTRAPTRAPDEIADDIQDLIESRRPLGSGDDTALLIVRVVTGG